MPRQERPRPRYGSFLFSGGLIGLVTSVVLLGRFDAGAADRTELTILLTVFLAGTGTLIGGVVAVLLEGRHPVSRRADQDAPKTSTEP